MKKALAYSSSFLIFLLFFPLYYFFVHKIYDGNLSSINNFANSFAILGVIFSGFAFMGLILSLIFQNKQLLEQQKYNFIQSKQNLLAAKISASISKQEIISQFIVAEKAHPELGTSAPPGDYRSKLFDYLNETHKLVKEAEILMNSELEK